jgi:hypothetical protein
VKLPSKRVARRKWYVICALFMMQTAGLFAIAPYWNGGALFGDTHALAWFVAGAGVTFLLLAMTDPGTASSTKANRYLFAVTGGLAFNAVVTGCGPLATLVPVTT